ncbi:unnamed protein product, partial [Closterium sp. NIES-53]
VLFFSAVPRAAAANTGAKLRAAKTGLASARRLQVLPKYYRGDKSDENVSWTFNINVPTDPTIEPMYFRLAAAGLVEPPRQISLLADPNLTLGTFGTNMKCTQIARTVWDCAGMTTLTQADSLRLGASAGVGPQFASYGLALTYWNEQRQAATVQTSQVEVAEDSVRF